MYDMKLFFFVVCIWLHASQAQSPSPSTPPECSSSVPVFSSCSPDIPAGNWTSDVSATELYLTSVQLSWTPHPDIEPDKQRRYEIYWRQRVGSSGSMEWRRTPRLNETEYDMDANSLSATLSDLVPDSTYEVRLCLAPTPRFPPTSPASSDCGFCTLCFETLEAFITLQTATIQTLADGLITFVCEASSEPTNSTITWDARISGTRTALSDNDPQYFITSGLQMGTDPPVYRSVLEYYPNDVMFTNPECLIVNEFTTRRVMSSEFQNLQTDPNLSAGVSVPVWAIVLLVIFPCIFISMLIPIIVFCKFLHKRTKRRKAAALRLESHESNKPNDYNAIPLKTIATLDSDTSALYGSLESELPSHMIIASDNIKVSMVIGQGEFGVVYKGILNKNNDQQLVAVKTLKGIFATANDIQGFTEEILILQHFDHPNVMSLIGVIMGSGKTGGGPSIVLPFMSKGSLLNFLRNEAESLRPSSDADVTHIGAVQKSLVQICLQIGRGMEYLAGKRFVHRDLAARNCMIDQYDQIRVGDFGLSEDIYAKNYFRQASRNGVKLPVKWMSPESMKLGVFTEKSDVWAYGVTCWEVFSCGEIPYPGVHPQQVLRMLEDGQRLDKPRNPACSDEMYAVLLSCWDSNPDKRNTFTELISTMEKQLNSMSDYLDLNILATSSRSKAEENLYMTADDSDVGYDVMGLGVVPEGDEGVYDEVDEIERMNDSSSVDVLYDKGAEDCT